jgi:hypothetical protein
MLGCTVFGIPHILDSVVLTTLRLGLLGSHIAALCCGVNDDDDDEDDDFSSAAVAWP